MNRISLATLPKRTITVTPSTTAPNTAIANPQPSTDNSPTLENISNQATGTQPIETKSDTPLWLIVVAALGYILWIGTVIFYLISRSTKNTTEKLQLNTRGTSQPSLNELKALAKTHDVKAFYTALNNFSVKVTHKNVGAIDELCIRVNSSELNGLISQLQAQLYSNKGANTDLNAIIKILENYQTQASKSQQAVLKDLYD